MKKIIYVIICLCFFSTFAFSQNLRELSESEKQTVVQNMIEQSKNIQTLQCVFVQEKTSTLVSEKAVMKGVLCYQSPSKLRWEYTNPTPSTLILNENDAVLLDQNDQKTGNEKMFKQLGKVIVSMINGSSIAQNKQFSSTLYKLETSDLLVILTPIQKRLKELYEKIELKIDTKTMLANTIILYEKSGDKMLISLSDKTLNSPIPPQKFRIP